MILLLDTSVKCAGCLNSDDPHIENQLIIVWLLIYSKIIQAFFLPTMNMEMFPLQL